MKHIFIVNPVAGSRNMSTALVPEIIKAAAELNADYEIVLTERPGHATELAESYAKTSEGLRIYACGGDGTLSEVIQGVIGYDNVAVGCIPCGSGNDFVRNFGENADFHNFKEMMSGCEMHVDLVKTPYGYASSTCSAGLDAQVAMGIGKWRRVPGCGGSVSYVLSALQEISGKLGMELEIELDGEKIQGEYLMAALCNGIAYGGGFMAAPDARLDDGLLDVILVKKIPRLQIIPLLGRYRAGNHIANGKVAPDLEKIIQYYRVKQVAITAKNEMAVGVDGECALRKTLKAEMAPGIIRTVLPKHIYKKYTGKVDAPALV